MKFTIVILTLVIGIVQARLRVDREWSGGFQGAIEIPVKYEINNGWELEIRFNRPVAIDVSTKQTTYSLLLTNIFLSFKIYSRPG